MNHQLFTDNEDVGTDKDQREMQMLFTDNEDVGTDKDQLRYCSPTMLRCWHRQGPEGDAAKEDAILPILAIQYQIWKTVNGEMD